MTRSSRSSRTTAGECGSVLLLLTSELAVALSSRALLRVRRRAVAWRVRSVYRDGTRCPHSRLVLRKKKESLRRFAMRKARPCPSLLSSPPAVTSPSPQPPLATCGACGSRRAACPRRRPLYLPGCANNYPLKGGKYSDWEGGVRTASFLSGGYVPAARRGATYSGLVSVADWYAVQPAHRVVNVFSIPPAPQCQNATLPHAGSAGHTQKTVSGCLLQRL